MPETLVILFLDGSRSYKVTSSEGENFVNTIFLNFDGSLSQLVDVPH